MSERLRPATQLVDRNCVRLHDGVMLPVPQSIQATTVLFDSPDRMLPIDKASLTRQSGGLADTFYYGPVGTPTTFALADNLCMLEDAAHCTLFPSGQAAIHAVMSVVARAGDEVLVTDSVTYTTRWMFDQVCARAGVSIRYFPATDVAAFAARLSPRTKAVFFESPGSMLFEIQEVAAMARLCRTRGIVTVLDNTWSASTFFNGFRTGLVDCVVLSLSKYHGAPMGVSGGAVLTNDAALHAECVNFGALVGATISPDAAARIAAGLPNLRLRLAHQSATAMHLLPLIADRVGDEHVFHPAHRAFGQRSLWERDFRGANSLLTVRCPVAGADDVRALLLRFRMFRHGYGWGGDTSLVNVVAPNRERQFPVAPRDAAYLRLYVGMEDPADLERDLMHALGSVCR
ncbi:cystathionine beta-lyase [Burkholderia lata]|uniref:Cystathionine beta-lyase n=1 Tax=Burkholderia lata (strain ATCC 17760 / DSM 23089 / LMG 22485 / NCIMB 9086 / R18194 / 383) TaxID=482957 RepID=A0A6P2X8J6_BURL3|nr:aminotransferase class I/II-fold pyridoxal phosphate-dependent enzyme [Burkholderia lata]VWD05780.1 cystathionine beta-lyase [Burkholderia lata]